jgi:SPP1 family predicted phage head-tail adaptor
MTKRSGGIEKYNRWVTFYTATVTADSYGGQSVSWAQGARRRARVRMLYGQEIYLSKADQEVASKRLEIAIRKGSDVTPAPSTMRLKLDATSRYLDIESSDETVQRNEYVMICKEVAQ